jgi:two-component system cell cycle response regulator
MMGEENARQPSTILIVDDQLEARQVLGMWLEPQGYRLAFANSGAEALAQAIKLVPDLILLDVMMPDMDGFEVCRRLRAHPLLAEVPIIMITALTDRESRLKGIDAGADDFISKTFDGIELRARVRSITRLNRYRRLLVERVRFRWVVERAEEGYLTVDEDDQVLYVNPRARLYLGLPEQGSQPTSARFLELVGREYHCEPRESWENWPEQPPGQSPRYLVRPETLTARAFWLQVDVLNLPEGPDMTKTVRLRDVTEQMNTLRDMSGFHALITHKLLTPIGHMVGNLDLLAQYYRAEVSIPEVSELFETAHRGGRRLSRELNDVVQYLRDLSSLARERLPYKLTQIQPLVIQISETLRLTSVQVSFRECPPDASVSLSEHAVELILWEVLENAKKFHPQQDPTVEISVIGLGSGKVCLRFSDDGLTLSPEQLTQVWTPYYQGEKYFTGEVAGVGLGLTMVATLVWGVGGTCRIRNRTPGPGVVVELVLPLVLDPQRAE